MKKDRARKRRKEEDEKGEARLDRLTKGPTLELFVKGRQRRLIDVSMELP